jgi:hypothetical protein
VKELVRKLRITYRLWRTDGKSIEQSHVEVLEDRAMELIQRQMRAGNVAGELCENLYVTVKDPENGIDYRGHWEVKRG